MKESLTLCLTALFLSATPGMAQRKSAFLESELSKTITKRISLRHLIHLPEGHEGKNQRWPLLLYLHGGMGRGNDFQKIFWYPVPKMILENAFPNSFVVVIPQCPEGKIWTELSDALLELIHDITGRYKIDTSRIYGIGYSMGGNGIAYLAYANPEIFAAIAPMSGFYHPVLWGGKLKNIPAWFFHGVKDATAGVDSADQMVEEYRKDKLEVKYSRDPEGIHQPPSVEQHLELLQWLLTHAKGKE
jgi:predicted peptidase